MWFDKRRDLGLALVVAVLVAPAAVLATDLETLEVTAMRGQSAEQSRRDRYECHNWAVEQTGVQPIQQDPESERAAERAQRINKVILGSAIGAAIGGILRGNKDGRSSDAADGALAGAVAGAAAGAIAGEIAAKREEPEPIDDYARALAACMAGRGYELRDEAGELL